MKLSRETAHLVRDIRQMALVAALIRLRVRREQQLKLQLGTKGQTK